MHDPEYIFHVCLSYNRLAAAIFENRSWHFYDLTDLALYGSFRITLPIWRKFFHCYNWGTFELILCIDTYSIHVYMLLYFICYNQKFLRGAIRQLADIQSARSASMSSIDTSSWHTQTVWRPPRPPFVLATTSDCGSIYFSLKLTNHRLHH